MNKCAKTYQLQNSDIWQMLQSNLDSAYNPRYAVTINWQLFHTEAAPTSHKTLHQSLQYGMKIWWLCDSHQSNYLLRGIRAECYTLTFEEIFEHRPKIWCPKLFYNFGFGAFLIRKKTAYVGILGSNKVCVVREHQQIIGYSQHHEVQEEPRGHFAVDTT